MIDFILELRGNGYEIYTIMGNHEQLLLDSAESGDKFDLWMYNGGI